MGKQRKGAPTAIEVEPDAWDRFKAGIHAMVKAGPQHREAKPKTRPASKGRARKAKAKS